MKTLKKDLKSVVKELKSLTKKAERIALKLDKLSRAEAKAARKVKATPKNKTPKSKRIPASDVVFSVIKRSRKGINTSSLVNKTGFKEKKVRDIIYRLKKQGKVKSAKTGLYIKI